MTYCRSKINVVSIPIRIGCVKVFGKLSVIVTLWTFPWLVIRLRGRKAVGERMRLRNGWIEPSLTKDGWIYSLMRRSQICWLRILTIALFYFSVAVSIVFGQL